MHAYHPLSFLHTAWRHRQLIIRLAWRKIEARYRGSMLGLLWTLLHPLLMLAIYTFVFSVVFRAKWDIASGGRGEFAIFLFSGLIVYAIFAECVNEAPLLMHANEIYVKQLIFPTEVLAWVSLMTALFNFGVGAVLLVGFQTIMLGTPPLTALYVPLVIGPVLLLTLGMVWLLSSLGLFLRDISQMVGVLTTALLFLSPIFYSPESLPEALRNWYFLNPFAVVLEMSKASLFYGAMPEWSALARVTVGAWIVAWGGYAWFMKTKGSFADVL